MQAEEFVRRVWIQAPASEVFAWHARAGAFERLCPPWERVEVLGRTGGIEDGARVELRVGAGPFRVRWTLEHEGYAEGREFSDVQVEGPFRSWRHTHRIVPEGEGACYLEDRIAYALPMGSAGRLLGGPAVRRKLDRMFDYRHRVTVEDLKAHRKYAGDRPLRVLVSGASGLIGSALVPFLTTGGHTVLRLVRRESHDPASEVRWDPGSGRIDASRLEGLDAVVHLAGENIAAGRWTAERKRRILESRVAGTRLLADALGRLSQPPRALVCASAVGYYGDRGDEVLREESAPGTGFLPEVARAWEAAAQGASERDIRTVHLRFGMVLSPAGGALASMLPAFRVGAGGRIGSGKQYMSWISIEDAAGAIYHAMSTPSVSGPVNAVAPYPVAQAEFAATLGRVLKRPAAVPVPAGLARLAFGEMADALLLSSARAEPAVLKATGYPFRHPKVEGAIRQLLGR